MGSHMYLYVLSASATPPSFWRPVPLPSQEKRESLERSRVFGVDSCRDLNMYLLSPQIPSLVLHHRRLACHPPRGHGLSQSRLHQRTKTNVSGLPVHLNSYIVTSLHALHCTMSWGAFSTEGLRETCVGKEPPPTAVERSGSHCVCGRSWEDPPDGPSKNDRKVCAFACRVRDLVALTRIYSLLPL